MTDQHAHGLVVCDCGTVVRDCGCRIVVVRVVTAGCDPCRGAASDLLRWFRQLRDPKRRMRRRMSARQGDA